MEVYFCEEHLIVVGKITGGVTFHLPLLILIRFRANKVQKCQIFPLKMLQALEVKSFYIVERVLICGVVDEESAHTPLYLPNNILNFIGKISQI